MNDRGAYYNENDEFAAAWLKNLVAKNLVAPGEIDTRSIVDVRPSDLAGYSQCHFFAGIGVWSYALRCAGWPDDRHVWTGSCPCGPFSQAGKGQGFDDERHLWPAFYHLIGECEPRIVFGEQVASKDGLAWLDLVQADMENAGHAFAALDLCAAGIGAPHIRQRLYWVAHAARESGEAGLRDREPAELWRTQPADFGTTGILVDSLGTRLERYAGHGDDATGWPFATGSIAEAGPTRELGNSAGEYTTQERAGDDVVGEQRSPQRRWPIEQSRAGAAGGNGGWNDPTRTDRSGDGADAPSSRDQHRILANTAGRQFPIAERGPQGRDGHGPDRANAPAGPVNGLWRNADWLLCRDGKWRPVEAGTFPLAHGAPQRVGRLRGYGNAIVAPLAQAFIEAVMEAMP